MIDDLGLLAARLTIGLSYASHGAQKAFGWFGGPGPQGAAGFMESLGYRPGRVWASTASYGELTSGLLIALGLGGPLGPAGVIANMIVAQNVVHREKGYYASQGGMETGVLYAAGALAIASSGYGALSLDRALGAEEKLRHPVLTTLALGGAIAAGFIALAQRDTAPPPGTLAEPTFKGSDRTNGAVTSTASPSQ